MLKCWQKCSVLRTLTLTGMQTVELTERQFGVPRQMKVRLPRDPAALRQPAVLEVSLTCVHGQRWTCTCPPQRLCSLQYGISEVVAEGSGIQSQPGLHETLPQKGKRPRIFSMKVLHVLHILCQICHEILHLLL